MCPVNCQMEEETAEANGTHMANGNGLMPLEPRGGVRVGVVFAGRQAAGGHNIIWGLHEFLKGTDSKASPQQHSTRGRKQ